MPPGDQRGTEVFARPPPYSSPDANYPCRSESRCGTRVGHGAHLGPSLPLVPHMRPILPSPVAHPVRCMQCAKE